MAGERVRDRLEGPWPWWLPLGLASNALVMGVVDATRRGAERLIPWILIAVALVVVLPLAGQRAADRKGDDRPTPGTTMKVVSALAVLSGAVSALVLVIAL